MPLTIHTASAPAEDVSATTAMRRGFLCRCPACNKGRLFGRFLKVVDRCEACGTEFHHHRADDFPPYIVMFIVGHLVGYGILMTETKMDVALWVHLAIWPLLTLVLSLALLQPVKGAVVGLQYALGMHGFGAARAQQNSVEEDVGDGRANIGQDGFSGRRGA
ncbi:DUF983 domain-containing protein [Microvirga guangxiensis]|uniref:Uncharacterized conserved protein, DUF983 family n=1 Tax=Microvirga guangxiensis TaxID=549386 RepID=A0A1G5L688_9HYPH|nr:DUF983 domain-containing protein [Microvirga guangxiensis]SCZ07858.1 Uncharacterized conserved protein, DUF983 family [Microvirga guangxiensis]